VLQDPSIERPGDLGWTFDYATAWLYRHVISNQFEIAEVIDKARRMGPPTKAAPYIVFDIIDEAIFGGKIKGNVFLKWNALPSFACGRTSAPNVVSGIGRVCIELNSSPFENGNRSSDRLLDAVIHQMIHAFFLICCGRQPREEQQDGRLSDGVQFGVILLAIKEASDHCRKGLLNLIFRSATRHNAYGRDNNMARSQSAASLGRWDDNASFISIHPRGGILQSSTNDSQTHCSHDNRGIEIAQLKNWQVHHYALALEMAMDQKGDVVYELTPDRTLAAVNRMDASPSSGFVELVWNEKRIMVSKIKASEFPSVKSLLQEYGNEIPIPKICLENVLFHIHDFIQMGRYGCGSHFEDHNLLAAGPPTIQHTTQYMLRGECKILDYIRVSKIAEEMGFDELATYSLSQMNSMPMTFEDPIELLIELYRDGEHVDHRIGTRLREWARQFLVQGAPGCSTNGYLVMQHSDRDGGMSNYERMRRTHAIPLATLRERNRALNTDLELIECRLFSNGRPPGIRTIGNRHSQTMNDPVPGQDRNNVGRVWGTQNIAMPAYGLCYPCFRFASTA
jgi:hypothetical protein